MAIHSLPGGSRSNWNGTAWTSSQSLVVPDTPDDVVTIVKEASRFPSPLRPVGEMHSMNDCFSTDGRAPGDRPGTLMSLRHLARIEPVAVIAGRRTVTAGAGAQLFDVNRELARQGLQLPVSPEIGNATAGSVACCGTKDSSLAGGPGQVSATVVGVTLVDPSGAPRTLNILTSPGDLGALAEIRSSYGLLGVVTDVTFLVEPVRPVEFTYAGLEVDPDRNVIPSLDAVLGGAEGFLGFLQPYSGHLLVERRRRVDRRPDLGDHVRLQARNFAWEHAGSFFATVARSLPAHDFSLQAFDGLIGHLFENFLRGFVATRGDCMIDFGRHDHLTYFDFTFWAFPASAWSRMIRKYFAFCRDYEAQHDFRPSLFTEVYFIHRDQVAEASLLSFAPHDSPDEFFFTLDVVDALAPAASREQAADDKRRRDWNAMNVAYDALAAAEGGIPLFNQTKQLTRDVVLRTPLADRWRTFSARVRAQAAAERLLNPFFDGLLA